jgi:S-adenosylmethionine/arginine decarboxylase-like enzyme|tara:strand:+ start:1130 stop:1540 length:411 start_codon:yes stop_codon:yes gene_type:complete
VPGIHKHLIIRAEVNSPPTSEKELKKWLRSVVKKIDMKILQGPFASYVTKEGNRGVTGMAMIETSHIAIHVWDEYEPALVQCDVYSCANFSSSEVLALFSPMGVQKMNKIILDRAETTIITKESGIFEWLKNGWNG